MVKMVSKVKVAFALLLVTLVLFAKATSDDDVMLDFPAFDTLTAAPSRNMRSTEAVTTTSKGNGEERGAWFETFAKLMPKKEIVPLNSETASLPKTEIDDLKVLKEESEKIRMAQEGSKNKLSIYEAIKKWWASLINSKLRKDDKVKRLIKNVDGVNDADEIGRITTILEEKHFQRWYNMRRSAADIHQLLGLPQGPDLLESPLVWTWLDYAFWVGKRDSQTTIKDFYDKFGNEDEVAKMFEAAKNAKKFRVSHADIMTFETLSKDYAKHKLK